MIYFDCSHRQTATAQVRQQGIALIVVMVMLLLGTVLVLSATRTNWLNELVVGNESDYHRAYAAAEALVRDAETDIRGVLPGGAPINPGNALFFEGSGRLRADPYFPLDYNDLDNTILAIPAPFPAPPGAPPPCRQGICVPSSDQGLGVAWWNNPVTLVAMTARAATYGQFTRADPAAIRNPLLLNTANRGAWYWVEILQYASVPGEPDRLPKPDLNKQPFFFRITALVQGQKPGTRVVLRTVFVPRPSSIN